MDVDRVMAKFLGRTVSKGNQFSCSLNARRFQRQALAFCGPFSMRGTPLFTLTGRPGRALRNVPPHLWRACADERCVHPIHMISKEASPAPSRGELWLFNSIS